MSEFLRGRISFRPHSHSLIFGAMAMQRGVSQFAFFKEVVVQPTSGYTLTITFTLRI